MAPQSGARGSPLTGLPIPPRIWAKLVAMLAAGYTGPITLHAVDGHIKSAEFKDIVREDAEVG